MTTFTSACVHGSDYLDGGLWPLFWVTVIICATIIYIRQLP